MWVGSIYALSKIHAGEGADVGFIDLPIQRERHTGFPVIRASAVKGVLRDECEKNENCKDKVNKLFGPPPRDGKQLEAGALIFSDARILAFPVRGYKVYPFWWVTCPYVLNRYLRDVGKFNEKVDVGERYVGLEKYDEAYIEGIKVRVEKVDGEAAETLKKIFEPILADKIITWDDFKKRLIVVPDNIFALLVRNATEVVARIVIDDDTKTTKNLWYEEFLPMDTILYFTVSYRNGNNKEKFPLGDELATFIGGDITVGSGVVYMKFTSLSGGENNGQRR